VKDFKLGGDQLFVRKAQQILQLIHQVVFVPVHFAVNIDDAP
jgi:hypothetical protein